ncbi:hypothetical protein BKA62DRAFT_711038 [Auriculariales sp. MPI-PUGE-AT-0066]|nr:hypothetical protein BKA62DRAFT_711038 [Auriculariales sp. MPI-PUGE-AT-0066]
MSLFAHARTIVARSPARIRDAVESLRVPQNAGTMLFALSANAWHPDIPARLASKASHSVGCISAPLNGAEGMSALSVAFVPDGECVTFSWAKHEHADSADDWAAEALGETSQATSHTHPSDSFAFDQPAQSLSNAHTIVSMTAKPSVTALQTETLKRFPAATQIGLLAAHTPFVTGHPSTMFHNGNIVRSGAVGLALTRPSRSQLTCSLDGFRVLTPPVRVGSARGNIIHTLNKDKATRHLLLAIHNAGMDVEKAVGKDDEFYLALLRRDSLAVMLSSRTLVLDTSLLDCVLQINSGDPSRGSIAVESEWGPETGDIVQILHRSVSTPSESILQSAPPAGLNFTTSTLELLHTWRDNMSDDEVIEMLEVFTANSENGFMLRQSFSAAPWVCSFPGVATHLRL